MTIILSDGQHPPLAVNVKYLAVYDDSGVPLLGADQLTDRHIQTATLGDPDLQDICLRHGLPYKPPEDVTSKFPSIDKGKVFSVRQ